MSDMYGFIYDIEGINSPDSGMEDSWRIKYVDKDNKEAMAVIGNGSSNRFEVVSRNYAFPASFPTDNVYNTAMSLFTPRQTVVTKGSYMPGPAVRVQQPASLAKHGGTKKRNTCRRNAMRTRGSRRRLSVRRNLLRR
jgi:hypothetical protein